MNATQWTALKKQPDKAKKMLSALHMSPAYLKVSWGELDEGDQKKVSKWVSKNASGWFEVGEPTNTPKGIKNVAPKHRKAAVKKESERVLRVPMKKEKPVRTVKKKPWQMTKQEWLDENLVESGQASRKKQIGNLTLKQWKLNEHRNYVEQAIIDGKPIPERVLKEYPELTVIVKEQKSSEPDVQEMRELEIKCPECNHNMIACSREYSQYTKGVIKEGEPICRLHGSMEMIKQQRVEPSPKENEDKGEIRAYKNYGLVWTGDTSREDVTSIDYYRVEKNPPKDVSYQGSKSFHGDSAGLYYSESNKETYILPRDTKEYLIHLRNEKIERKQETPARTETKDEPTTYPSELDSASDRAKKSGIDLEGLYVDDTDGIRFRMQVGAFKGKTAFRCPECYRGLVFNSDSKLACGEHGSLTSPDKVIDLRRIGIDDKTTEWARNEYESWLSEAKVQGFKTVSEYVDSMKGKGDDHGYGKYAELGRGFEKTFITGSKGINQQITNKLFKRIMERLDEAEKEFDSTGKIDEWQAAWNSEYSKMYNALPEPDQKQIDSRMYGLSNYIHERKLKKEKESEPVKEEQKKSATMIYLEGAYKKRLESMDTSPIPLSNPEKEEITDAIEFAKTIRVPIIMHFDKVDIQMRYWKGTDGSLTRLEIIVFDEDMNPVYDNKGYDMNMDAAEVFRIRDAETNALLDRRKAEKEEIRKKDEAREQEEQKKKQFRFNKTTYSLYLKTYPYAMSYFLNDIVHIPLNADPQNLTDKELGMINEVVAEGYDIISDTGVYTVEWFKGMDEMERADEARYEAEQEKEKPTEKKSKPKPNSKYFKTKEVNGKLKKEYVKEAYPFEFGEVNLFSHKEGAGWHVTEQTTGLMFTSGTNQNDAESAAKEIISSRGGENVLAMINQAKQVMESQGGIV